jgi:hypothetical protein
MKARAELTYILGRLAQSFEVMKGCEGSLKSRTGQDQLGCKVIVQGAT